MKLVDAHAGPWPGRYELLDGLRGLAALCVVLTHLGAVGDHAGHLAVMVFFVISGYCITASATANAAAGIGFRQFMLRRVRRIYPPYLCAIAFFAVTRFVKSAMGAPDEVSRQLTDWIQNLTLTQWLSELFHPVLSPVQNPKLFVVAFWSLNYEEQFYLVMAVALALSLARVLPLIATILILAGVGLIWNWLLPGAWICGLFIEYWVHFALGACLFYVLTDSRRHIRLPFVVSTLLIGACCGWRLATFQGANPYEELRAMTELAFLSLVALGLLVLRPISEKISRSPLWRPIAALGTISYSLYLVHQFNLTLVKRISDALLGGIASGAAHIVVQLALLVAVGALFWWFCERPFLPPKRAAQRDGHVPNARVRPA
jgi:peptidoglycan/LPS O-acetylase OafA/YrhL